MRALQKVHGKMELEIYFGAKSFETQAQIFHDIHFPGAFSRLLAPCTLCQPFLEQELRGGGPRWDPEKSQEEMQWEMGSVIELPAPAEGPSPAPSFLVLILFFPISLFLIFFLFYFLSSCLPFPFHFLHYYSCLTTADKHWETQCQNLLVKGSLLVSLVINHHL